MVDLPVVILTVPCFDRRAGTPFPLKNKSYRLDWTRAEPKEQAAILAILEEKGNVGSPKNVEPDQLTIRNGYSGSSQGEALSAYRHLFSKREDESGIADPVGGRTKPSGYYNFLISPNYVEDETGTSITKHEMISEAYGNSDFMILGDANSILRWGPMKMENPESWTASSANMLDQFLRVVRQISNSDWIRKEVQLSGIHDDTGSFEILGKDMPEKLDTHSIVTGMRQLYASGSPDQLFIRACNTYMRHTHGSAKQVWIKDRQKHFIDFLKQPQWSYPPVDVPAATLLDTVLYGARIMHASSKKNAEADLASLVDRFGKPAVEMAFQMSLRSIHHYASSAGAVIEQDFRYWIDEQGYCGPDVPTLDGV